MKYFKFLHNRFLDKILEQLSKRRRIKKRMFDNIERDYEQIKLRPLVNGWPALDDQFVQRYYKARIGIFENPEDLQIFWYCDQDGEVFPTIVCKINASDKDYPLFKGLMVSDAIDMICLDLNKQETEQLQQITKEHWFLAKLDGSLDQIN